MHKLGHEPLGNTPTTGVRLSLEDRQYLIAVGSTLANGIRETIKAHKELQAKLNKLSK